MSGEQVGPASIDKLVHEPARMALLSVLDGVDEADFVFLQRTLGLTQGNLSTHLAKLEAGALVTTSKSFQGRTPRTTVAITTAGHAARERHWQQLQALRCLAAPSPPPREQVRAPSPQTGVAGAAFA